MKNNQQLELDRLQAMLSFLQKVSDANEDTRFDKSEEPLVQSLINLCYELEKTSITEDFEQTFIHPMITIQKWSEELKLLVEGQMQQISPKL